MASNTRAAATRERWSAWVAAGSGEASSNAASGTRARTASSAPLSEPAWVASTPRVRAPQLANPASAVVRPRPMPVVPAPCRATSRRSAVRVVDAAQLLADGAHHQELGCSLDEVHHARRELAAHRGLPGLLSARQATGQPGHGRGREDEGHQEDGAGLGRNHHRAATVPAPTSAATRNGCSTRSTTSCSESTSSTKRATRSPRRKAGRPAGATASSRSNTRTRRSASTRSAASWPTSRSP